MGMLTKNNEELDLNNDRFSPNAPPWCSTGRASERNKAQKIPQQPCEIRSHFLLKNERETLHKDKSVQNSSCFGKRKNCRFKDNTEKYWIYKVLALFVLSLVVWQGITSLGLTSTTAIDGECCYKMKQLITQLSKAEYHLRYLNLSSEVLLGEDSDYFVKIQAAIMETARRKHTIMLTTHNNIPATLNAPNGAVIQDAVASKGDNTEEWQGRAALWGVVPLWRASPSPQIVLSARSPTPADCWPFSGTKGELNMDFENHVNILGMSIEHIYPDAARSAPDHFRLYGVLENGTWVEAVNGRYSYKGPAKQVFTIQKIRPLKKVVFRVYSNHGNPKYTCVYRVHIYGA